MPTSAQTQPIPTGQSSYNAAPSPQSGSGFFGAVPGTVGLPNPYQDLSHVVPNLSGINADLSGQIASDLSGQVSPSVLAAVNSAANGAGIDTSHLDLTNPIGTLGTSPEALQTQGMRDYSSILPIVSSTQTVSPNVEAQLAEFNAQNAAKSNSNAAGAASTIGSVIGLIAALA